MSAHDYVIVGAGISGAALAYYLKKGGAKRVLVLERGEPASGGTGKSAAIVRQHYSTPLMARLAKRSVDIFRAMPGDLGHDGGYRGVGYCFLISAENEDAARKNIAMQQQVGITTLWLDRAAAIARFPWLNPERLTAVGFEPFGGYADPVQSVEAYLSAFKRIGGEVRTRVAVRKLLRDGDRVTGIVTDDGPIPADMVVNAAGPWAPALARLAGLPMEMRSMREQDTVWEGRPGRERRHMRSRTRSMQSTSVRRAIAVTWSAAASPRTTRTSTRTTTRRRRTTCSCLTYRPASSTASRRCKAPS